MSRLADDDIPIPRRRMWPVIAAFFLIAAAALFFVVRALRAPQPLRVLIAVDVDGYWWEGSQPAAALADKLGARLSFLGFDVVKAGDPEVARTLEGAKTAEEAARKLHAAFVVTGTFHPDVIEHALAGKEGTYHEARTAGEIVVRHIDGPPGQPAKLHGFAGGKEKARAVSLLAESMADQAFDAVLPRIMNDPSIVAMLADRQSNVAPSIFPARDYLLQRDYHTKKANDAYQSARDARAAKEKLTPKPTIHSSPSAHDQLCGASPEGMLVSTASIRPFYFPDTKSLGWLHELETLEWRKGEAPPRVVWTGYNLFGYPSAAPDAPAAILVEDLFGWAKAITEVNATGKAHRVRVDPAHRFTEPKVSPGGKHAAMYDRDCATCPASLLIVAVADGQQVLRVPHDDGSFFGFTFIDARKLAFVQRKGPIAESGDEPGEASTWLFFVDLAASPPIPGESFMLPKGEVWAMPVTSPDGKTIAFEIRSLEPALVLYDIATRTHKRRVLPTIARAPAYSPDGSKLAFESYATQGSPAEIAVVPVGEGDAKVLTQNPFRDRYPLFSNDGKRIYYESIEDDPNYPKNRSLSLIASVPVP